MMVHVPRELRSKLKGPPPPSHFVSDGCTGVPEFWFREACRWHDWAYTLIENRVFEGLPRKRRQIERRMADKHLQKNIKILSRWRVVDGMVEKRRFMSRRFPATILAIAYWVGVRSLGGWHWVKGKTDPEKKYSRPPWET